MPLPKAKKRVAKSSKGASMGAIPVLTLGEGTSANLTTILEPRASILKNPTMVEKLLEGVIPPADKEEVKKIYLDWAILKFFHIVGQVII